MWKHFCLRFYLLKVSMLILQEISLVLRNQLIVRATFADKVNYGT